MIQITVDNGELNFDLRVISATGSTPITIGFNANDLTATQTVTVSPSQPLSILKIDPIVASIRLSTITSPDIKTSPNYISLEILPGIYYLEERTEVSLSAVLSDGRRMLITNPNEIQITSSDKTVAIVDDTNGVVGKKVGSTRLTISWIVCGKVLAMETINVDVSFDQHRPEFTPTQGNVTVPEDASVGYLVYTVQATDQDFQDVHTDDIKYKIVDDFNGKFSINEDSGEITITSDLDRESVSLYMVQIQATDQVQRDQLECQQEEAIIGSGSDLIEPCGPINSISVFTVCHMTYCHMLWK